MSIRAKAAMAVVSVVLIITAANMGMGLFFTQPRLLDTIESDMNVVADIADKLITSEINLLKANTAAVAANLLDVSEEEMQAALRAQVEAGTNFMALTVFNRDGVTAAYGEAPTPSSWVRGENLQKAFAGEATISTTRLVQASRQMRKTARVVFHVCVPMGNEHVLSATVQGSVFSDLLRDFRVWETGSLFIVDAEGTMIANFRDDVVERRENFIESASNNPNMRTMGEFLKTMINGGRGVGRYELYGQERLCVFTPISGSKVGWVLGVAAPLAESPASHVQNGLMVAALIFLGFGILSAAFLSGVLAKPFQRVEEQNAHLAELNEVAQSASKAKSRFLANMSHEMRTPLNAVVGLSELMLGSEKIAEETRDDLEKIHSAGMTLLGIVNDILDISKIESGKFELLPVEYDVPSLINDTVTLNIMRIAEKPIKFHLRISENLPHMLRGDELRVKQICNNLLSNAFKYTREGSVEWALECERDGDYVWLTIRVSDSGVGIKPEDLQKLFSEYNQVDTKSNRLIEGTGLGLSITKMMAEMMDGSITVESEYGRGSVFTARLRQGYVSDVTIGAEAAENLRRFHYCANKRHENAKLVRIPVPYARILVVDDVQTNLDVAKGMLKPYRMQVDCVTSGQQAINRIREKKSVYDAVFMDHMMPEMDGIETARHIRAIGTEYAQKIPIIALTANAIIGNEKMFLENGFQAFLTKPIDVMRLDAVIRQWVRNKEREKSCADNPPTPEARPEFGLPAIEGLDAQACLTRFGGDSRVYASVLRSYAVNTAPLLEQLRAVTESGLPEYAIAVHGIKGSSRGVGAGAIGEQAEELELAAKAGDIAFVRRHNESFIAAAQSLLRAVNAALDTGVAEDKPVREAPDRGLLDELTEHCTNYDMDGIDEVMEKLDGFIYEKQADLVAWLQERVALMEFTEISDRLREAS